MKKFNERDYSRSKTISKKHSTFLTLPKCILFFSKYQPEVVFNNKLKLILYLRNQAPKVLTKTHVNYLS